MVSGKTVLVVAALAAVAGMASAAGACSCSGHGDCGAYDVCTCWDDWTGADCSLRVCPYDSSWADVPSDTNVAHVYAECSGAGLCDRETGECQCREGYTGRACERTTCMNDCSGHGVCRSLSELAQDGRPNVGGNHTRYYQGWDAHKIQKCVCDAGYEGVDCSMRSCPRGDDPLTTGQTAYVNTVALRGRFHGQFSLVVIDSYGAEWTTRPLAAARFVDDNQQVTTDASSSANTITPTGTTTIGDGASKREVVEGDIVTMGGNDYYVTAVAQDTGAMTVVPDPAAEADNIALTRKFGGASASDVQTALRELPNRVLQEVTVSLDSTVDGDVDNVATAAAHMGVSYLVTFTSPAAMAHPLQVDACACTSVGCNPFKLGVAFSNAAEADGVYGIVTNGASALTVVSSATNTAAEWSTAFAASCDTTRHVVPKGVYYVEIVDAATGAARKRKGLGGSWEYLTVAATTTFDLYDGIQLQVSALADNDAYTVFAPFGIESYFSAGTKEDSVCSGRGLCDYDTGICQCFSCATGLACETQTTLT